MEEENTIFEPDRISYQHLESLNDNHTVLVRQRECCDVNVRGRCSEEVCLKLIVKTQKMKFGHCILSLSHLQLTNLA